MSKKLKHSQKKSRSVTLKKYASVYKCYTRKINQNNTDKSPRKSRKNINISVKKEKTIKSLNPYQKFVQLESKKEKYKNLPGKERLSIIANTWKKNRYI